MYILHIIIIIVLPTKLSTYAASGVFLLVLLLPLVDGTGGSIQIDSGLMAVDHHHQLQQQQQHNWQRTTPPACSRGYDSECVISGFYSIVPLQLLCCGWLVDDATRDEQDR